MNRLYFGDSVDILKKLHHQHPDGFIDLIYIDPPFNSKKDYNILFEDANLKDAKAQKEAFLDTWSNVSYKDTLEELKDIDLDLHSFLESLDKIRISRGAVAYLTTMAIRIWYIRKVLKKTGSFYLHCDQTMSHYLKILCDLIFGGGKNNFKNEIIWRYHRWSAATNRFQRIHDVLLFYTKSKNSTFNMQYEDYTAGTLKRWKGIKRKTTVLDDGSLYQEEDTEGVKGANMGDVWDISILNSQAIERMGYPTQKPETLLERIITCSSNEGDLVADFFCGCGTTVAVAQRMKRKWIGVDISHLAVGLIERRLFRDYGKAILGTYQVDGLPKDLASAKQLAEGTFHGRLKFQDWIIETMLLGVHNPRKTADGGWDGHLTFNLPPSKKKEVVLIEVKSGHVNVKNLREFIHVARTEKAAIGVLVCFKDEVTRPMLLEAKNQGYYDPAHMFGTAYDRIQIITVEDLLEGEGIRMPGIATTTFANADRVTDDTDQQAMF